jgi:prophage regulatory protein
MTKRQEMNFSGKEKPTVKDQPQSAYRIDPKQTNALQVVKRGLKIMHTILRLPDVKRSTGLSRSTIYLRIAQGTFPKPVSLGGRAVGWLEAEIQEWLQRRIDARRNDDELNGSHRGTGGDLGT